MLAATELYLKQQNQMAQNSHQICPQGPVQYQF